MNADLFFLLALQQTSQGCKQCYHTVHPAELCGASSHLPEPSLRLANPLGRWGAEENLLKSLIAGFDVSAAKQPWLPAPAAVDLLNSPGCFLRPDEQLMLPLLLMNSLCCHSV